MTDIWLPWLFDASTRCLFFLVCNVRLAEHDWNGWKNGILHGVSSLLSSHLVETYLAAKPRAQKPHAAMSVATGWLERGVRLNHDPVNDQLH